MWRKTSGSIAALCVYGHSREHRFASIRLGVPYVEGHFLTFQWNPGYWREIASVFGEPPRPVRISGKGQGPGGLPGTFIPGIGGAYAPAYFHKPEQFGIHLDAARIRALAASLDLPDGMLSAEDRLITAIQASHWQLVAHAWVEDLCCLLESMTGEANYAATRERNPAGLRMEDEWADALVCRMVAAYPWGGHLHEQLRIAATQELANPSGRPLCEAISERLRAVGVPEVASVVPAAVARCLGRSEDFADEPEDSAPLSETTNLALQLPGWGNTTPGWKRRLRPLLTGVYGYPPAAVDHALTCFFENPGTPGYRRPYPKTYGLIAAMFIWGKACPVHIHGGNLPSIWRLLLRKLTPRRKS